MNLKRKPSIKLILTGLIMLSLDFVLITCQVTPVTEQFPSFATGFPSPTTELPSPTTGLPSPTIWFPAPTPDFSRLDEPPLPSNPTQFELGRHLYWLNCMPCHGDRGQGLTAEFRSLYVEDANCWARGCHGGRVEDMGFSIPIRVPAVISSNGELPPFPTADQLFEYLLATHPPQHPGFLSNGDYWALTAYLLAENNRLLPGQVLGPQK